MSAVMHHGHELELHWFRHVHGPANSSITNMPKFSSSVQLLSQFTNPLTPLLPGTAIEHLVLDQVKP